MNRKYIRNNQIETVEIGNEVGMLDLESGNYHVLDDISAVIWEMLETQSSMDDIVSQLIKLYDVSEEQCRVDVEKLFEKMVKNSIIMRL